MKRILPLILALVAGMAQADSSSNYRAGSDFARQIQGRGTSSIQDSKSQESIPSYNTNPGETKYCDGVTAGGDNDLKNDDTTKWATGKAEKIITKSFMNGPKDILSPDAPFIQASGDVVSRTDNIVENTGQQCSAQKINRSEFTNYTCERDTMVEKYCTRTASITGDWKYTDEYREVTMPHSQLRFSMSGLKLVFSVTTPVTGTVEGAPLSVYAAFFFLSSRYTFMNTAFNVDLASRQSGTYPLSGATGLQVTQGQVLTSNGCTTNDNYLPHGNGDRKVYESLISDASTFTLKLRVRVRDKEWIPRVGWVESCPFNKTDGVLTGAECSGPGGTRTEVMESKPWSITQTCWAYRDKYVTRPADNDTCQRYVDDPARTLASRQCTFYSNERTCPHEYAVYSCESGTSGKVMVCGGDASCLGGECDKAQSGKSSDFGETVLQLATLAATGKNVATLNDVGAKASTGEAKFCRKAAAGFSNCCKDGGWGQNVGLTKCSSEEKALRKAKDNKLTVSAGEFCLKKVLGVCLQKKRSYCQFDSKLVQMVQQQRRNGQLRIGSGSTKHPDCRGITVNELQRIKSDKLNFTNFYEDLMKNQKIPDSGVLTQKVGEQIADQLKQAGQ